MVPQLKFRKHI